MYRCLQNFSGGQDEEWFRLVHVDIEQRAAPALVALQPMQAAAARGDVAGVLAGLKEMHSTLAAMQQTLGRRVVTGSFDALQQVAARCLAFLNAGSTSKIAPWR